MASKTVKVGSSVGLHARPASIIADAAGEFDEDIFLNLVGDDDEDETDAASSLMIMALGAEQGDEVTVTSDNEEAVEKIAALIEKDLDASEALTRSDFRLPTRAVGSFSLTDATYPHGGTHFTCPLTRASRPRLGGALGSSSLTPLW